MSQAPAIALPRLSLIAKAIAMAIAMAMALNLGLSLAPVAGHDTKDHTPYYL